MFGIGRQDNFEDRPMRLVRKRPKVSAMRDNDRLTDRKSDAHPGRLRRIERLEDLLLVLLVDSRAGVRDGNADFRGALDKVR